MKLSDFPQTIFVTFAWVLYFSITDDIPAAIGIALFSTCLLSVTIQWSRINGK